MEHGARPEEHQYLPQGNGIRLQDGQNQTAHLLHVFQLAAPIRQGGLALHLRHGNIFRFSFGLTGRHSI